MPEIPDSIRQTQHTDTLELPRYSIVVPCYNEQDSIVPLLEEIVAVIAGDPAFEIVIVDDCSEDETRARLMQARDNFNPQPKLVSHTVNCGQSAAICTGIDVARGPEDTTVYFTFGNAWGL